MPELKSAKQCNESLDSTIEFIEGKARLVLPIQEEGAPRVFYNPKMNLNRDIAILFTSSYFPSSRQLRLCDPMTASGVRAVRYVLETPNVLSVLAADNDLYTVEVAKATARINRLTENISVVESDANRLLSNHTRERFDLIDLDPFGSPAPFFENALRATSDGGVLAATATDMGPLTGARASACMRKYGVRPIRSEFGKEMAVRILAACLCVIAGRLELGIEIPFSHASDHYARIYATVRKGRSSANLSAEFLGFLEYCPECLRRSAHRRLESIRSSCQDCGNKTRIGGPIWLGPIWNRDTVQAMIERTPALQSSRLSEIQNILTSISEENTGPAFHYATDAFSRRLGLKPPSLRQVLNALKDGGFEATRTHFKATGFRTNAPSQDIKSILYRLTKKA
jgi:tRNA (guanine26-N2/guanine27-N2)-dimethyltransferase